MFPTLQSDVARMLMEENLHLIEPLAGALDDILKMSSTIDSGHTDGQPSVTASSSTQSRSPSNSSGNNPAFAHSPSPIPSKNDEEEEVLSQLPDPKKKEIAKTLMATFPKQSTSTIIMVTKSSPDVDAAASKLVDEATLLEDDESESRESSIKTERAESPGLDLMTAVESSQGLAPARAVSPVRAPTSLPYSLVIQDPVPSRGPRALWRGLTGKLPAISFRTGPTENHEPLSPKSSPQVKMKERASSPTNTIRSFEERQKKLKETVLQIPAKIPSHRLEPTPSTSNHPVRPPKTPPPRKSPLNNPGATFDTSSHTLRATETPHSMPPRSKAAKYTPKSETSSDGGNDGDETLSISGNSSSSSSSDESGYDENMHLATLMSLVPGAHINACRTELLLANGNVGEARKALQNKDNYDFTSEEGSQSQSQIMKGSFEEEDADDEEDVRGMNGRRFSKKKFKKTEVPVEKQPASRKRAGDVLAEGTPPPALKRARTNENTNGERQMTANAWAKRNNGTISVRLDSGEYPVKFTKAQLSKLTVLKDELKCIDENDPGASIRISGVEPHILNLTMQYGAFKRIQLDSEDSSTKVEELTTLVALMVFADKMRFDLGLHQPNSKVLSATKKILIANWKNLRREHIQMAYSSLLAGHQLRTLFVHTVFKPWMEFRYLPTDDPDAPDSDSESEAEHMNAAHEAAFRRNRPPFWKEMQGPDAIVEFRNEVSAYVSRSWHQRQVPTKLPRKSKKTGVADVVVDLAKETSLLDPLTSKQFVV